MRLCVCEGVGVGWVQHRIHRAMDIFPRGGDDLCRCTPRGDFFWT